MKRLLFESDVIKSIEKGCLRESLNCDPVWHTSDVISAIKDTPTAQPEIIRCGECKNHIDGRCIVANHYTSVMDNCRSVMGAERNEVK